MQTLKFVPIHCCASQLKAGNIRSLFESPMTPMSLRAQDYAALGDSKKHGSELGRFSVPMLDARGMVGFVNTGD